MFLFSLRLFLCFYVSFTVVVVIAVVVSVSVAVIVHFTRKTCQATVTCGLSNRQTLKTRFSISFTYLSILLSPHNTHT